MKAAATDGSELELRQVEIAQGTRHRQLAYGMAQSHEPQLELMGNIRVRLKRHRRRWRVGHRTLPTEGTSATDASVCCEPRRPVETSAAGMVTFSSSFSRDAPSRRPSGDTAPPASASRALSDGVDGLWSRLSCTARPRRLSTALRGHRAVR